MAVCEGKGAPDPGSPHRTATPKVRMKANPRADRRRGLGAALRPGWGISLSDSRISRGRCHRPGFREETNARYEVQFRPRGQVPAGPGLRVPPRPGGRSQGRLGRTHRSPVRPVQQRAAAGQEVARRRWRKHRRSNSGERPGCGARRLRACRCLCAGQRAGWAGGRQTRPGCRHVPAAAHAIAAVDGEASARWWQCRGTAGQRPGDTAEKLPPRLRSSARAVTPR